MKKIVLLCLSSLLVPFSTNALSNDSLAQQQSASTKDPEYLIKDISSSTLNRIRSDNDLKNGNTKPFLDWAKKDVINNFDFTKMTSLAMGKSWKQASPEQKLILEKEFETLLLNTFAKSFAGISVNQEIEYKPFKGDLADSSVTVKTLIIKPSTKPIELNYTLENSKSGWKIYDISLAGVSLITNYRESFNQEVSLNGIEGLIKVLKDKNKSIA